MKDIIEENAICAAINKIRKKTLKQINNSKHADTICDKMKFIYLDSKL